MIINLIILNLIVFWCVYTRVRKSPFVIAVPKFWYDGITIGWLIIIKKDHQDEEVLLKQNRILIHEYIHFLQQRELFVIGAYLLYAGEFLIKAIYYKSITKGYYNISFEREARMFEHIAEYPFSRKPYIWRHFLKLEAMFILEKIPTTEQLTELYAFPKATIFRYKGDFATAQKTIDKNLPSGSTFKYMAITVGSPMYAQYGSNAIIVTAN